MPLTRQEFIQEYLPLATRLTRGTGIIPSVMMAQAIIESQGKIGGKWYVGQSQLAKKHNNYFGIKANKGWTGKKAYLKTKEETPEGEIITLSEPFRAYENIEESFRDYIQFLLANPRYKKAGVFDAKTVEEQAKRLKEAGYATGSKYAELITAVAKNIPATAVGSASVLVVLMLIGLMLKQNA